MDSVCLARPAPPTSATQASTSLRRDLAWLLAAFSALGLWDASDLDLAVSRRFADGSGFSLRDDWFLAGVLHANAKWLATAICVALVVNVWRPLPFARDCPRSLRARWLIATLGCLALIPLLKMRSLTSCPWSLAEFGGTARHVSHWAFGGSDGGPGRCFPAGHASAAFCFLAGYFALRDRAPRTARTWLGATLAAGVLLGAVQTLRGAHYVSHSLWTAWLCWALTLVVMRARIASSSAA